jgi:hypothetical protein
MVGFSGGWLIPKSNPIEQFPGRAGKKYQPRKNLVEGEPRTLNSSEKRKGRNPVSGVLIKSMLL